MDSGSLSINLIARDNGVGLSRDLRLLAQTLRARHVDVNLTRIHGGKLTKWLRPPAKRGQYLARKLLGRRDPPYDVNIMLEHVRPQDLPFARHNVLIPNPEWFLESDHAHLDSIDLILAKTHHAEDLFRHLGVPVVYTGFTCCNHYEPSCARRNDFFHLAGRSNSKGTERILQLWRRHPEWPLLTVVQNPRTARPGPTAANIDHRIGYFDDAEIRRLQNQHRFHLCPSETEGYGHYLTEAMAVGAVPITVDAPPMNEMVSPDRGLLVATQRHTGKQNLATTFFFDEADMEQAVEKALSLDNDTLERKGAAARSWISGNTSGFGDRLEQALRSLGPGPAPATEHQAPAQKHRLPNSTVSTLRQVAPTPGSAQVNPPDNQTGNSARPAARLGY